MIIHVVFVFHFFIFQTTDADADADAGTIMHSLENCRRAVRTARRATPT